MKRHFFRRQRGIAFTLVELLVVIGIIAILAAVVIGGVSAAIRFAKRTKANADCVEIQTAVQSYNTEYGSYPYAGTPPSPPVDDYYDGTTGGAKWGNLTIALCGNIDPYTGVAPGTPSTVPNTRNIAFLTPTRSDLDTTDHTLANPFGTSSTATYFFMVVDTDYSGVAGDSGSGASQLLDFTSTNIVALGHGVPGGVAVWCSCDQPLLGAGGTSRSSFWAHSY